MTRMAATRDGYGQALLDLASNEKVVVLEADLGKSTKSLHFRKAYPERTFSFGIGEQNMMLGAAGLASSGYIPFASTFAIFTERGFEQVRNGIARPNLSVHLCGSHGGVHTGTDGSSAQSIEDLAIYRTLPNMTILHPCDDVSTRLLTIQLADHDGPSYTRTARNSTPVIYDGREDEIVIGKGIVVNDGNDVAIFACGVALHEAVKACHQLEQEGVSVAVIDMHTIKPLDIDMVNKYAKKCGAIVTAEDHSVIGGLGSAIAEHLVKENPTPMEMIGVQDRFGESAQAHEMLELMGITHKDIANACQKVMTRKN